MERKEGYEIFQLDTRQLFTPATLPQITNAVLPVMKKRTNAPALLIRRPLRARWPDLPEDLRYAFSVPVQLEPAEQVTRAQTLIKTFISKLTASPDKLDAELVPRSDMAEKTIVNG